MSMPTIAVVIPTPSNPVVVVPKTDTAPKPVTRTETRIKPKAIAETVNKENLIITFSNTAQEVADEIISILAYTNR
jgi:hypothetical protein